jgi:hypothetical protein
MTIIIIAPVLHELRTAESLESETLRYLLAVAIIFPSGDRSSADHVGGALHPDVKTQAAKISSITSIIKGKPRAPDLLVNLMSPPFIWPPRWGTWLHSPGRYIRS